MFTRTNKIPDTFFEIRRINFKTFTKPCDHPKNHFSLFLAFNILALCDATYNLHYLTTSTTDIPSNHFDIIVNSFHRP